ncbi:IS200/IS605 family transposase [Algoriphagus sp. NG3]|uniref:IS200/IS605 family transposase n=1 Tax=Algoriphagus sp. NG3 TaxID=3097546 RepID=UPI002A80DE3C|nr:IS200/IS605 family transposase [Algoriphagus sp. NG3]WPR77737.1 IS200/IS605 family transposase [Algoriphagus sp. NG3]
MPFIKVYIHFVWSTKNRFPYLNSKELRLKVWNHIRENAEVKGIFLDFVNGYADHCHCLVSMTKNQTIEKIMQLIKGESSYWINKNQLTTEKFEWQDEYFAVSVSESQIGRVRRYIQNQEEHHRKKTFNEECDELIIKHGFQLFKDV